MASIIRIKRSGVAGNPATLAAGELAYSALTDNGSNGGDRLYIGFGTETAGNAANHYVIGGKYFTDMMDHSRGTLTASSAIITDSNNKIDNLKVDNLDLDGNTLSSTNENGNILLDPIGTGYVQAVGTNVFVLPVGNTSQRQNNVQGAIRYNTETSSFEGYSGSNWGSLGGVKSVDGLTYITAESSPGASDDTLSFVTNNVERLFIDTDSAEYDATVIVKIDNDTQSTTSTNGALVVAGGAGIAKDLRVGGNIYAANFTGTGSVSLGNINITNNTISSTNTNGNIILEPNGTGDVQVNADTLRVGDADVNAIVTTNGTGNLTLSTNEGTDSGTIVINQGANANIEVTPNGTGDIYLNADTLRVGDANVAATVTTNGTSNLTLSTNDGTDSGTIVINQGANANIEVTPNGTGDVYLNADTVRVGDANAAATVTTNGTGNLTLSTNEGTDSGTIVINQGANGNIVLTPNGTGDVYLNADTVRVGDADVNAIVTTNGTGNLTLSTNEGTDSGTIVINQGANGNIVLTPNGTGTVNVNSSRITSVAEPVNASDAATKSYVDTVAEGLHVHEAAHCATTDTLASISGGTVTYDNGTNGVGATLTITNGLTALDGHTLSNGDRILVKDETNQAHNGIYVRTSATVLTRASDFDTGAEIAGGDFTFVENGTLYGATGWVQIIEVVTVGDDNVIFRQFSGSGTFTAGDGLILSGTEFNVVGTTDRISVSADAVDIASTYVGQTSITTLGTIGTGTWQGTTIATGYGGTGLTTYATGDILYASASNTLSKLEIGTEGQLLQVNASGVPVWAHIDGGTY